MGEASADPGGCFGGCSTPGYESPKKKRRERKERKRGREREKEREKEKKRMVHYKYMAYGIVNIDDDCDVRRRTGCFFRYILQLTYPFPF